MLMHYFPRYLLFCLVSLSLVGFSQPLRADPPKVSEITAQEKLEPQVIEILKAKSDRLAAACTLQFTAVTTDESPSRLGPPLADTTRAEGRLPRSDRLRVLTLGDGPATDITMARRLRPMPPPKI